MGPEVNAAMGAVQRVDAQPRRMVSSASLTADDGDVVVTFEVAGIWRGGPGLAAPTTQALPEYRVSVRGERGVLEPIFEIYDRAVADGDALAADRKVRLFYAEGDALTLLKDYRPGSRL
jgi:hypothetical protein